MPILDYTTQISAHKTIGEIQQTLAAHGARKILTEYSPDGKVVALSFMVDSPSGLIPIQLPVNAASVQRLLERQKAPKRDTDQAERVAWRNLYHWVCAQMALIETGMVTIDQVMLPYMTQGSHTVYELFRDQQFRLTGGDAVE